MPKLFGRNTEKRNHTFSPVHYHQKFIKLDPAEMTLYQDIQNILEGGSEEKKQSFSKNELSTFGPEAVFKLAENYPEFEAFCQHDEFPHVEGWAGELKKAGYPYAEIVSLDGENVCTVYDHYVNSVIDNNLHDEMSKEGKDIDENARTFWMSEGCKYNSYYALCCRSHEEIESVKSLFQREEKEVPPFQFNENAKSFFVEEIASLDAIVVTQAKSKGAPQGLFSKSSENDKKKQELLDNLDETLDIISHLYMTLGHMFAAKRYYEMGQFFAATHTEEGYAKAYHYYLKAAEKFFAGEYLMSLQKSDDAELLALLTQGRGLTVLGYASLSAGEKDLLASLPATENVKDLRDKAKTIIEAGLQTQKQKIEALPKPSFS